MKSRLLPLRDLAREQAREILTDAEGQRRISELLAVAFLRGYTEAQRDEAARDLAIRAGFELECA